MKMVAEHCGVETKCIRMVRDGQIILKEQTIEQSGYRFGE